MEREDKCPNILNPVQNFLNRIRARIKLIQIKYSSIKPVTQAMQLQIYKRMV